jgi:hypothetical protein
VKLSYRLLAFAIAALLVASAGAVAKEKEKEAEHAEDVVDSGSFGVFMNGHRVGTETFSVTQDRNGSVVKSEFKTENDPKGGEAVQSSEMRLSASGEIRRYDWKELSPEKAASTVVPNDQFLTERWSTGSSKEHEQPFLLPLSTSILDDYFFVHREILVWRFLAASCKQDKGVVQCPLKQRAQFGTLDPRQHASAPLTAEYMGREKIEFKGSQQEFNKVELRNETGAWQLWLDDHFKLVRILIESDNTEVVRD